MKHWKRITAIALTLLSAALFAGCDGTGGGGGSDVADLDDGKTRIALIINGDLGDMSFFDSANAGMLQFQKDHPETEVNIMELGSSDTSKWESTLTQTANEAYDLIIVATSDMREPLQRLVGRSKYADRRFIIFDTEIRDNAAADYPTVHSMMFKQNEGGFLAGAVAALLTLEKGAENTAFVGGARNDIINDFACGFMQGVQKINELKGTDVGAYNSYIGDFTNSPKGKQIAESFYDQGVEVLFQAASQAGLGCFDAAKTKGKLAIGVDSDQYDYYASADPAKADTIVTSVLKRVDLALYDACEQFLEGTLEFGVLETLGIREGMIGIVENDNYAAILSEEDRALVGELAQGLADGTIEVKSGLKRYMSADELNALFAELDPTK